jgi:hypothetical protein
MKFIRRRIRALLVATIICLTRIREKDNQESRARLNKLAKVIAVSLWHKDEPLCEPSQWRKKKERPKGDQNGSKTYWRLPKWQWNEQQGIFYEERELVEHLNLEDIVWLPLLNSTFCYVFNREVLLISTLIKMKTRDQRDRCLYGREYHVLGCSSPELRLQSFWWVGGPCFSISVIHQFLLFLMKLTYFLHRRVSRLSGWSVRVYIRSRGAQKVKAHVSNLCRKDSRSNRRT